MVNPLKLFDAEYKFMNIVWAREPVNSTELTRICEKELGWKKPTTYSMIKKLSERGIMQNEKATVTTLIARDDVQKYEADVFIGMEMSCDEAVLRKASKDIRGEHSTSLLSLAMERIGLLSPIAFGESNVKERVENVLSFRKRSKWVTVVSVIAVVVFLVGFSSDRISLAAIDISNEQNSQLGVYSNTIFPLTNIDRTAYLTTQFEIYRNFRLIYDPITDHLYFNGELVRYFEDFITLDLDGNESTFGITHFTESGIVDVRAVRDSSRLIQNSDGSTDLSDTLLGLQPFSQAEFNAREVDNLPQNTAATNSFGVVGINIEKLFDGVEDFGITFSGNLWGGGPGNIYYNGQLVRVLVDAVSATYLSSSDRTGNISVAISRHRNGDIAGVHVAHEDDTPQSEHVQPRAWDGRDIYNGGYDEYPSMLFQSEAGRRAVDIIQRTGNWSIVEPYLPYISNEDIRMAVDIFNSKQTDTRRHIAVENVINAEVSSKDFAPPTWRGRNIMRPVEDSDRSTLEIFEGYGIALRQGNIYFNEQLVRSIVFYTNYDDVGFIVYHSSDTSGRLVIYVLMPGTPNSMSGSDIENYIRLDVVTN